MVESQDKVSSLISKQVVVFSDEYFDIFNAILSAIQSWGDYYEYHDLAISYQLQMITSRKLNVIVQGVSEFHKESITLIVRVPPQHWSLERDMG